METHNHVSSIHHHLSGVSILSWVLNIHFKLFYPDGPFSLFHFFLYHFLCFGRIAARGLVLALILD